MKKIYSKLQILKQDPHENKLLIQLSNETDESDVFRDFNRALYDASGDEEIIRLIGSYELEQKKCWGFPGDVFKEDEVLYAMVLKYKYEQEEDAPELGTYPQQKGKLIQWNILFEAQDKDVDCTFEYFLFYRDSMGNIFRLHTDEHELPMPLKAGGSSEMVLTDLRIVWDDERMLDTGRYYLAFRLRKSKNTYIGEPVLQFINIVPAKQYTLQPDSQLVGLDAVYQQMALLTKQKIFNDRRLAMHLAPAPINLHAAVMGEKGTGKTSFAHVLYEYYGHNELIGDGALKITDASAWKQNGDSITEMEELFSEAAHGMLYIENAASMIAVDARGDKEATVRALLQCLKKNKDEVAVVLADAPERITQLLAIGDLQTYMGTIYRLPVLNLDQMMEIAQKETAGRGFVLSEDAKNSMKSYLSAIPSANSTDVRKLIDVMIMRMSERVVNSAPELFTDPAQLSTLLAEDVPQPQIGRYKDSLTKLNNLVGLKSLKYNIETHLNLVRFARLRQQNGLQAVIPPLHMIFTGNPGTGKTTVASLLGEIYASLGILKTGQVIKADRKKLVGQYIGDTEDNTKRALQQSHGNILFIDEAYTLVSDPDDKRDYGSKVLDCLLDELGKENSDMIIILAGYPDEMEKMLQSNKGLQSRFPYTFHFEDYSEDELMEIAVRTAQSSGYTFSEEAYIRLQELVHREVTRRIAKDAKHFGNARFITRLISTRIIPNMSRRVLSSDEALTSPLLLSQIEASDVPASATDADYTIDEAQVSRALNELEELTGREEVKQTMHNLVALARTRQEEGEDLSEIIPLQWTFTGATGTGKSSVARLLAQVLHAFHLISSDRMTQLRMPQAAQNTWSSYDIDRILRDTMKQAGQGLLFIDLDDIAGNHIDVQWLRCKLTSLTAEMPGSYAFVIAVDDTRLPLQPIDMPLSTSVIHFSGYTADELMAILCQRLAKHGFTLAPEAEETVQSRIQSLYDTRRTLANARTIKHICTALEASAQLRSSQEKGSIPPVSSEKSDLTKITKEDVEAIKWKQVHTANIGFKF